MYPPLLSILADHLADVPAGYYLNISCRKSFNIYRLHYYCNVCNKNDSSSMAFIMADLIARLFQCEGIKRWYTHQHPQIAGGGFSSSFATNPRTAVAVLRCGLKSVKSCLSVANLRPVTLFPADLGPLISDLCPPLPPSVILPTRQLLAAVYRLRPTRSAGAEAASVRNRPDNRGEKSKMTGRKRSIKLSVGLWVAVLTAGSAHAATVIKANNTDNLSSIKVHEILKKII